MKTVFTIWAGFFAHLLSAHTIVISSLPDPDRPLKPLSFSNGLPLGVGTEIRIGAFPNCTSDELIDAAAEGGLSQILEAFVQFGETATIGTGTDATPGSFEIVARETTSDPASAWNEQAISIILNSASTGEFLVAKYPTSLFVIDSPTGIETLTSLHFSDSQLILGQDLGPFSFTSSRPPGRPSFGTWIEQYTTITDPDLRTLNADPDGDGRSNFLEYVTGGNPTQMNDFSPAQIVLDLENQAWFRVSILAGIGLNRFQVESATSMNGSWLPIDASFSIDPSPPSPDESLIWMRYPVAADQPVSEFFRLKVTPNGE